MPNSYTLPADGTDVRRKFVIPVPLKDITTFAPSKIRPSNKKIIHHAIVHIDESGLARALAEKSPDHGIDGIVPTPNQHSPPGHFLSWLPGMVPYADDPAMSWRINPGTDLVIDAPHASQRQARAGADQRRALFHRPVRPASFPSICCCIPNR